MVSAASLKANLCLSMKCIVLYWCIVLIVTKNNLECHNWSYVRRFHLGRSLLEQRYATPHFRANTFPGKLKNENCPRTPGLRVLLIRGGPTRTKLHLPSSTQRSKQSTSLISSSNAIPVTIFNLTCVYICVYRCIIMYLNIF